MQKVLIAVVVAVFCVNGFAMQAGLGPELELSDGSVYSLSFQGGVMLQSGEARELVYDGSHQLSELIWDISGLALAGGSVSAAVGSSLQINAGLWVAVNKGNGSMEDYDWYIDGADWTHFSDGDVEINSAYMFDINGAYTFYRGTSVELYGILGYKRLYWDWSEYGRSYIYSVNDWRDEIGSSGGVNGIDYEQRFDVPYAGFGARVVFGQASGSVYAIYSPFVTAEDKDHHILRDLYFKETFEDIDYLGFGGEFVYNFNAAYFFTLSMDMHAIPEARGDMEIMFEDGYVQSETDNAGIENVAASMSFSAGRRL